MAGRAVVPWVQPCPDIQSTFTAHLEVGSRSMPRTHSEIWEFARREMETPDVPNDTRLNKATWAKGIRNVPHHIPLQLSRKCTEDEDEPNKLCWLPVTTFKILQKVNVDEN